VLGTLAARQFGKSRRSVRLLQRCLRFLGGLEN